MLRAYTLEFEGNQEKYLQLIEFTYNNSYQSSIQMAPCKALYGYRCESPISWFESSEIKNFGLNLATNAMEKV